MDSAIEQHVPVVLLFRGNPFFALKHRSGYVFKSNCTHVNLMPTQSGVMGLELRKNIFSAFW